ncbi:MAG: hypothetical protein K2N27_03045 [Ruminococcus sp.]|nr:hypothetical protein [Ruminococcus sp.]
MNYADELRRMEKNRIAKSKYHDFINYDLVQALRSTCPESSNRRVTGYYFFKDGYDNDTTGFTDQSNDESTYLQETIGRYAFLANANLEELKNEIEEKLKQMSFQVNSVKITKGNKTITVENGYTMFGGKKKYKKAVICCVQIYIDIQW